MPFTITFKWLFLFISLLLQDSKPIVLDDNGVTLKCTPSAEIGKCYSFNGKSYLIVDNESLRKLVKNNQPTENVVTTHVTDMSYLFYEKADFNGNISHWDVSNVTNMSWMFGFCEEFNSDISYWNTENVEIFSDMFHGTQKFNADLSKWNVSNGTHFNGMFFDSNFNNEINSWNVSKAINMSGMFDDCTNFNQPLSNWDVSNVKKMGGMFAEAIQFNQDISMWDVSNVTDMENMFRNAVKFEQDLTSWTPKIYDTPKDFNFNSPVIGPKFEESTSQYLYWLIPIPFFSLIYFYKNRRRDQIDSSKEYKDIIEKLKVKGKEGGYLLTKSEFDLILNIENLDYDKQKRKRSEIIYNINKYSSNLISRVRDPNDKRSFLYKINY